MFSVKESNVYILSSKEPKIEYCNNVLYIIRYQSRDVIYPILKGGRFVKR